MFSNAKKKICVVTPCYNAEKYIAETIYSVIENRIIKENKANLDYVICDGSSEDNTVSIVTNLFDQIKQENIKVHIISEPDNGLYDALAKGFQMFSEGDAFCYLNAGDYFSPHAFEIVLNLLGKKIKWLTGLIVWYNEHSQLVKASLPAGYRTRLIKTGFYGTVLPFIQQESTFWDSSLHSKLDLTQLKQFKLAGDYYIWKSFAKYEQLFIVQAWLGGFKIHPNQLSSHTDSYYKEMELIRDKATILDYMVAHLDKIRWNYLPDTKKKRLNKKYILQYNHSKRLYE